MSTYDENFEKINNIQEDTHEINNNYLFVFNSLEEKIIRKKLNEILTYCYFVIKNKYFKEFMNIGDNEMIHHVNFLIDKLSYILFIFQKYIIFEFKKKYNFILTHNSLSNMIDSFIINDSQFRDSKIILTQLYTLINIDFLHM